LIRRRFNLSKNRHIRIISIIIKIAVISLLAAILIGNLYLIWAQLADKDRLPKIFGFAQIVVISGSMQPYIEPGDLIVIREQDDYGEGEVVTYRRGRILITHRIIGITESGVITKGDANNAADEPIELSDIEGKVVLRIPGVGNMILFLKKPAGILAVSCFILLLYGLWRAVQTMKNGKGRG